MTEFRKQRGEGQVTARRAGSLIYQIGCFSRGRCSEDGWKKRPLLKGRANPSNNKLHQRVSTDIRKRPSNLLGEGDNFDGAGDHQEKVCQSPFGPKRKRIGEKVRWGSAIKGQAKKFSSRGSRIS